jgi:hypothetical protein
MSSKFLFSLIWLIAMGWSQSGQTNSRMCTYRVAVVMTTICWQVYAYLKNEATVLEVKFRPGREYSMVLTFERAAARVLAATCPVTRGLDALRNPWVFTSVERNS